VSRNFSIWTGSPKPLSVQKPPFMAKGLLENQASTSRVYITVIFPTSLFLLPGTEFVDVGGDGAIGLSDAPSFGREAVHRSGGYSSISPCSSVQSSRPTGTQHPRKYMLGFEASAALCTPSRWLGRVPQLSRRDGLRGAFCTSVHEADSP
jgi:hypothetical protein